MIVGYARVSTVEQCAGMEGQQRDLTAAGAEKIFEERISSRADRAQLEAAITFCRKGDVLIVTKLDRLARSIRDLVGIIDRLKEKEVALKILAMPQLEGATGRMMIGLLGVIAEFERELMLERQREGIGKAKAAGKYRGRAPTARNQLDAVVRMAGEGMSKAAIGRKLHLPERTVFRLLAEAKKKLAA